MLKFVFALVLCCLLASPSHAAPACYSPAEKKAISLLRLHSELMVITVTCHQGSQGENLATAYSGFTKKNIRALHQAEHTMAQYYTSHGGAGQDDLDHLRTHLANEFGQRIADMSAQPYCDSYRDKVLALYRASPDAINDEVEKLNVAASSCQ